MAALLKNIGLVAMALIVLAMAACTGLIWAILHCHWDAATTYATVLAGFITAAVVVWQGYLIKQQIAFSTYLDLDNEWNSEEMLKVRRSVHAAGSEKWDHSSLEAILEFFEKLASMFKLSGDTPFIYQSTLGWYAARYFVYAHEHGQIHLLREQWREDDIYSDLEEFFNFYVGKEVGPGKNARTGWTKKRLATEAKFWEQEAKG